MNQVDMCDDTHTCKYILRSTLALKPPSPPALGPLRMRSHHILLCAELGVDSANLGHLNRIEKQDMNDLPQHLKDKLSLVMRGIFWG